ncbi:MAG TPA: PIN domain-containing protein [Nitrospirae bacterium]|nr:PIN domain-containing protein [Nitrospirota bacterium]
MKQKLFIDTWGWIVILNKREPRHADVRKFYREFRVKGGAIYTTDYIIDETLTLLFRRLPFTVAHEAMGILDNAIKQGYLKLEWISPLRFEKAKDFRLKFQDKPEISFTDLTSMVVMGELGLSSILTDDDHFIQVGMGFKKMGN